MLDIAAFLTEHGISYDRFEHAPVFTCEQSRKLPPMPGASTKNLFLRDGNGKRHILIVVECEKRVDLKALRKLLHADKLSFASPERLKEFLGVDPGSATILGLICDSDHRVEVIIDQPIWDAPFIQCHPLVNTATVIMAHEGLARFLEATGHAFRVMEVPERT